MRVLKGVAAAPGIAFGPAYVHRVPKLDLADGARPRDPAAERLKAESALAAVAADLDSAAACATGDAQGILRAQASIARDSALGQEVAEKILEGTNAAQALVCAADSFAARLEATGNPYVAARAPDIRAIGDRSARLILGIERAAPTITPKEPSVVVAEDLSPLEASTLDPARVLGLATVRGGVTSHTAIVARSLGIPAVLGVARLLEEVTDEVPLATDGDEGYVYVDPDKQTCTLLSRRQDAQRVAHAQARMRAGVAPTATRDGVRIEVAANIRNADDLRAALREGAEAVGLLRTELLYLDRDRPPSEAEQIGHLRELRQALGDRRLVVRTFDIGSDKAVPFLPVRDERNPELGVRGIRLAQRHPDLLDTQLRAIAAVAPEGHIAVMAPMIASVEEVEWFVDRVGRVMARGAIEIGVMVETPAAVLVAGEIAPLVDFISIGTNDLSQYLHAADRRLKDLDRFHDPFCPALLRAVNLVCASATGHAWVGVCGEAARQPGWALLAIGLGVRELSMSAAGIAEVRAAVRGVSLDRCAPAAESAVHARDAARIRAIAGELLAGTLEEESCESASA